MGGWHVEIIRPVKARLRHGAETPWRCTCQVAEVMAAWLCCKLCLVAAAQYLQETAEVASADMDCSGVQEITDEQAALQMGAWAIFAAPLIMGNDVRNLTKAQRNILLNKSVIAINQDPLGTHPTLTASSAT